LQKILCNKDMFMLMPPAINSAVSVCKFLATYFSLYMVIGIDDVTAICLLVLECAEFRAKKIARWRWAAIQQTQGSGFLWLLSKPSPWVRNNKRSNRHISREFQHVGICCFKQHLRKAFSLIFSFTAPDSPLS
jgi:hypothetical protein